MINRRFAALLFLSSYAPAFVLVALRSYERSCPIFVLSIILICTSVAAVLVLFGATALRSPYDVTIKAVEARNAEVAAYAATYLLPFVSSFGGGWRETAAVVLFFVFIGVIHVNSGMIHVNPLLALLGFHLFEVRASTAADDRPPESLQPQFLLARSRWIRSGDRLTIRELMPDTLINFDGRKGYGTERET